MGHRADRITEACYGVNFHTTILLGCLIQENPVGAELCIILHK